LALNESAAATALVNQSIEIEPNYAAYQGNHIVYSLSAGQRRQALILFHQLKSRYPLLGDYDVPGIQACLGCGEVTEAETILKEAQLVKSQADELATLLSMAAQTRSQFGLLDEQVRHGKFPSDILQTLNALQAGFPYDPLIQANLGFTLFADQQYQSAYAYLVAATGGIVEELVMACWVGAAFCLLKQSQWEAGMSLLNNLMLALKSVSGSVHYLDVPGITVWMHANNVVRESLSPSAARLLEEAINDCPDRELITPEIRELAALYRQTAN
jgi:tetratricopeptide (TPR) repeat protein